MATPLALGLLALGVSSATNLTISVDTSRVTHTADPLFMGCHSDRCARHCGSPLFSTPSARPDSLPSLPAHSRAADRPTSLASGFAHTERNFYSQMIYGESFEFGNQSSWHYIFPHWWDPPKFISLNAKFIICNPNPSHYYRIHQLQG